VVINDALAGRNAKVTFQYQSSNLRPQASQDHLGPVSLHQSRQQHGSSIDHDQQQFKQLSPILIRKHLRQTCGTLY